MAGALAAAVLVRPLLRATQRDDQVKALLVPHRGHPEQAGHVNDAQSAKFHVVACHRRGSADNCPVVMKAQDGEVIGHKTIAPDNEGEGCLTFADARPTFD